MKLNYYFIVIFSGLVLPVLAFADVDWSPNSEPDMKDYQVYGCLTPSCVLIKASSTFLGTVPQTTGAV